MWYQVLDLSLTQGTLFGGFLGFLALYFFFRGRYPSFHNKHGDLVIHGRRSRRAATRLIRRDALASIGRDASTDPDLCEPIPEGPYSAEAGG